MRKINTVASLSNNLELDDDVKAVIKSEINNLVFQHTVGIRAGTFFREKLIELNSKDSYKFGWKRLRMADLYIYIEDEKIVVNMPWYHNIFQLSNYIGIACSGILFYISTVLLFIKNDTLSNIFTHILYGFGSAIMFFLFAYSFAAIYHAKELSKSLKELRAKEVE